MLKKILLNLLLPNVIALWLTLHVLIPDEERKFTDVFIFALLCGASKMFILIYLNFLFILIQLFETHGVGMVNAE